MKFGIQRLFLVGEAPEGAYRGEKALIRQTRPNAGNTRLGLVAPRYSDELALLHEKERQRGNGNRVTLAVAMKMVALMLAVERRNTDYVPAAKFRRTAAA